VPRVAGHWPGPVFRNDPRKGSRVKSR
jgi:hypothetical protein